MKKMDSILWFIEREPWWVLSVCIFVAIYIGRALFVIIRYTWELAKRDIFW